MGILDGHFTFAELEHMEQRISSGIQEALEFTLKQVVDTACSDEYEALTSQEIVDAILRGIDSFVNRPHKAMLRGKVKRTRAENGIE